MKFRRVLLATGFLLAAAACSSPIDPVAYEPPKAPALEGPTAPNEVLRDAVLFPLGDYAGPEDVDVDTSGNIIGGTVDGNILKVTPQGEKSPLVKVFANTGGRPLGLAWDKNRNLIVADAAKGLLSISPAGEIDQLSRVSDGVPFGFTDDVDVSQYGPIYFSDASSVYGVHEYLYDLLEAKPHGRLLRYDPDTRATTTLLKDLYFANGVAISENEDFVLVNETYRYRITRYWLKGPKTGTSDIFIDNLPGFPDGISRGSNGIFWVALYTVRNGLMDAMHPHPTIKRLISLLPRIFWPKPEPYGLVLGISNRGNIVTSYHDAGGKRYSPITSVQEVGGHLYLGSLSRHEIARVMLPEKF